MSLEIIEFSIVDLQDKEVYEYAFSTYRNFSISGKNSMVCSEPSSYYIRDKDLRLTICDDEPTLKNTIRFLRYAPIDILTHFDYTELVGEEEFFPKLNAILDCLKDSCPNLCILYVQFLGSSDDHKVKSSYLHKVVNYKNLSCLIIKMILDDFNTIDLIEYCAEDYLIVNGNLITNNNTETEILFEWYETTHKPVRKLELYECSFFNSDDLVHLLELCIEELCDLIFDIVYPTIFLMTVEYCRSIETLHVNFKEHNIIKSLMGMSKLEFLSELSFENLHREARPLVMNLFNHKNLKKLLMLKFRNCESIDDNVMTLISLNCRSLKSLTVSFDDPYHEISDFGIMSILYKCPILGTLELYNIRSLNGYFLAFIRSFPRLMELKLKNCSVVSPACLAEYENRGGCSDFVDEEEESRSLLDMCYSFSKSL